MKEPAEVLPHGDTVAKNSAKQRAKMMPNSKRLSRLRLFCPESAGFTRKHGHLWQTAVRPCCRGMGRIAPPRPLRGSARLGRTNGAATRQRPHPRRPSSAPMPTSIGVNAEPVLSLLYLCLLFFYLRMGYPRGPIPLPDRSPPSCQPFVRDFRPCPQAGGSGLGLLLGAGQMCRVRRGLPATEGLGKPHSAKCRRPGPLGRGRLAKR